MEQDQQKLQEENTKRQFEYEDKIWRRNMRQQAIMSAIQVKPFPSQDRVSGNQLGSPTTYDPVPVAEKIYQWLIKE